MQSPIGDKDCGLSRGVDYKWYRGEWQRTHGPLEGWGLYAKSNARHGTMFKNSGDMSTVRSPGVDGQAGRVEKEERYKPRMDSAAHTQVAQAQQPSRCVSSSNQCRR